jgi:hypothetical protein
MDGKPIDPKIIKRITSKKFRSLNETDKSFRARSLLALFIAQGGRSRFNLLMNFGDSRLRYVHSDDFVDLALDLKENHANCRLILLAFLFHPLFVQDLFIILLTLFVQYYHRKRKFIIVMKVVLLNQILSFLVKKLVNHLINVLLKSMKLIWSLLWERH